MLSILTQKPLWLVTAGRKLARKRQGEFERQPKPYDAKERRKPAQNSSLASAGTEMGYGELCLVSVLLPVNTSAGILNSPRGRAAPDRKELVMVARKESRS